MTKTFAKLLIKIIPTHRRNFDRLVRKFDILYNADKVKNKYRLYAICDKISNNINNQRQLDISYELLYKIP